MATYKKFELNIPEWVEFSFDKSYNWPYPSGENPDRVWQGKNIKGGPYWSFSLAGDMSWSVNKHELAVAVNEMLANSKTLAIMKFPGTGDDKKHYHAVSDGVNFKIVPNTGLPQRFAEFMITAPQSVPLGGVGGGSITTPKPSSAPPTPLEPPLSPNELMQECLADSVASWQYVLRNLFDTINDKDAFSVELYNVVREAAKNGLAATAHSFFINRQGKR